MFEGNISLVIQFLARNNFPKQKLIKSMDKQVSTNPPKQLWSWGGGMVISSHNNTTKPTKNQKLTESKKIEKRKRKRKAEEKKKVVINANTICNF